MAYVYLPPSPVLPSLQLSTTAEMLPTMKKLHLPPLLPLLLLLSTPHPTSSSPPPPTPATALLSADLSTLYLFLPPLPSTPTPRFLSLHLNSTLSPHNLSTHLTTHPTPPGTAHTLTPLLFSTPSSATNTLDEKLVLFSGSCDAPLTLYEYNLTDATPRWQRSNVVPADALTRVDVDQQRLLPMGRMGGRAFAYSVATRASAVAPSEGFMTGQAREGSDEALREYEQGVVVTTSVESKAFLFGGQCPRLPGGGGEEGGEQGWGIGEAMYSGSMLAVKFPTSRTFAFSPGERKGAAPMMVDKASAAAAAAVLSENDGHDSYGEWPIPEAGFSLTTIPTGDTSLNAVIIGGHTEKAFVDMRQVAVYQVPEGRWKFANVDLPRAAPPKLSSSSTRVATDPRPTTLTETTREDPSTAIRRREEEEEEQQEKDTRRIDPRSGHTAVATKDGKRIVVYGGWVGDTNTPAEPRLIVLELTGDAGGGENWRWDIPYTRSGEELGPPSDGAEEGLSGHAAVMLDGDVMLLTSGYRISPFANASEVSESSFFYNVTAASWVAAYKPPRVLAAELKGLHDCDRARRTTGIVLGVVLGAAALAAMVIGYFWYFRRGRKGRDAEKGAAAAGGLGYGYAAAAAPPLERERWGSFGFYGKSETGPFYSHSSKQASQERITGSSAKSIAMSAERVGIVETRSHSYRVLGDQQQGSRSATSDDSGGRGPAQGLRRSLSLSAIPAHAQTYAPRPPPKALLKTNPVRVSTIFEADEYDRRSSCGATVGSDDLADLYHRSLAFAEKMAAQETIYEQRSGTHTPSHSDEWSSDTSHRHNHSHAHAHVLPRPPPRAALSSESLQSLPTAPLRIPYVHSIPPPQPQPPQAPKIRTLLTPARFFPVPTPAPARRRVMSTHGVPSPPASPKGLRRWTSISALRNALPDILPTSPISLWEGGLGLGMGGGVARGKSKSSGASETLSIPIALDAALLVDTAGGAGGGGRFSVGGDEDWDLEAAIEKRVVQVMFTAPRGALRVVNLDEKGVEQEEEEVEEVAVEVAETETETEAGQEEETVVEEGEEEDQEEVVIKGELLLDAGAEGVVEMMCQ